MINCGLIKEVYVPFEETREIVTKKLKKERFTIHTQLDAKKGKKVHKVLKSIWKEL